MTMRSALGDLVVLDLSHALAGPFASTMLGDYGAEIIKIEPLDGEIARAWGPPFYGDESAYFVNLNRNKKSIALDLKQPDGRAVFFRLLERADVVLENLRVGTVDRLGIGYEQCMRDTRASSVRSRGLDGAVRTASVPPSIVVQAESGASA
jgi:formyl-CoA transferase/CoA:oxalate CoA-transferase